VSTLDTTPTTAWEPRMRLSQLRVIRSEWTKLYSVRSTLWSLLAAVFFTIMLPVLFALVISAHWSHMRPGQQAQHHDPLTIALAGVNLSQLAISILGVLVITGEYSTGMIRSTMAAVPKRLPALWAKAIVFALVTFVLMVPSVFIAYFASQAIVGHIALLHTSLSDPGVVRTVLGGALYLTVFGVFALALGAITRNTAAGIASIVALFFVIPPILELGLPASWNNAISPYLPSNAGRDIFDLTTGSGSFSPWGGFALFVGYTAIALAIAAGLLTSRDV
jgi:ABC-2 type transport system permease protein